MSRHAVIDINGNVINTILCNSNDTLDGYIILPSENAAIGDTYTYSNNEWIFNTPIHTYSFEEVQKQMLEDLSSKLEKYENAGVMYRSNWFRTDYPAQLKFMGVALSTMLDSNYSVSFKTTSNYYVTLNAPEAMELCQIVKTHIQSCYSNEAQIIDTILNASNITQLQNIDINYGWCNL